ncbi:MAG: succinylglutamate desuccinylase [Treponema sp.]|nr:succinylglutamate desuccinylase [Treponema sp.]
MKKHLSTIIISVCLLAIVILSSIEFLAHRQPEEIIPGPGVTEIRMLSEWLPSLRGTRGDTEVYILRGSRPGGSIIVLGGNHPNEPGGYLSAVLLVENAVVDQGTLYVLPRSNNSGFSHSEPQNANPQYFSFTKPDGSIRSFRYGSRLTNPLDQWPDPDVYIHASSGENLSGNENRNLNRAFPGRPDGNFTERVAYAITELIRQEDIFLTIDLHEASPEYPVVNAIVSHERAYTLTATVIIFGLEDRGIQVSMESSPTNLRGLTHREFGDFTDTLAVLPETTNPAQGRLRGRTDEALVLTGKDKFYVRAQALGRLFVPYDESGHPLEDRVGRHLTTIEEFALFLGWEYPEQSMVIRDIPQHSSLLQRGIGAYLR